ncbi:hypothetical protein BB8028_0001g06330 [Beauveria bassiana]|uniref:Defensin domain protein n=1 Tax=Beauveria bassiana TaxID=176275 RepID=A0A2S7XXL9_BEABA|nr:hypothetical protein BB8028_0001g06330 [Beauveria bassiana]
MVEPMIRESTMVQGKIPLRLKVFLYKSKSYFSLDSKINTTTSFPSSQSRSSRPSPPSAGTPLPATTAARPGKSICACYPNKRSNDEGAVTVKSADDDNNDAEARLWEEERDLDRREVREAAIEAALRDVSGTDDEHAGETAPPALLATRSACCSLLPPAKGLCCEAHCSYIGKPGGQCQDRGKGEVCYCN